MYQVIVRGPDGTEATYELGVNQGLLIGRDETCDIVLASKRVSRRHARLFTEGERLSIEDLGSQNGLFVGGARLNGISEIRPGPPIEIGEFKVRVVRPDGRAGARTNETLMGSIESVLRGLGPMAGREFKLPSDRVFVGREPGVGLTIENDSVSRKHAELRAEGQGAHVVTDLGSSNGTFVNGEALAPNLPKRLRDGDKVRFGETHWQYVAGLSASSAGAPNARLRKVIAGVVIVFAALLALKIVKKPTPAPSSSAAPEGEVDVSEMLAKGQRAMEDARFDDARMAFSEVIDADRFNDTAIELKRKAEHEAANKKRYEAGIAKDTEGRGHELEALENLFAIETDSVYFTRAGRKVQEISAPLIKKLSTECREARKKGPGQALEPCSRYLSFQCHRGVDEAALKILREAEHARNSAEVWTCPAKLAPFFGGQASVDDSSKALAALYAEKDLREAVASYMKGEIDDAIKALAKLKAKNPRAAELLDKIQVVNGRFKEGASAERARDNRGMIAAFEAALRADQAVSPAGVTSFHAREMRTRVSRFYLEQGNSAFDKKSYVEAYEQWAKGLEFQRSDPALQDAISKLEAVALEALAGGADCDELTNILKITRADPPSVAHQKAAKALAGKCEQ